MVDALAALRGILIDACSLLNLYASRNFEGMLRSLPVQAGIVDYVAHEALYVYRGGAGDDRKVREQVDLQPFISGGLLRVFQIETEAEAASLIQFAAQMDDGEAATCAVAYHRGFAVVTDDRKAVRLFTSPSVGGSVVRTSHIVRHWAELASVDRLEVQRVLLDIQMRGNFHLPNNDPLRSWWQALMNGGELS